jgi:hypothetical protein
MDALRHDRIAEIVGDLVRIFRRVVDIGDILDAVHEGVAVQTGVQCYAISFVGGVEPGSNGGRHCKRRRV